MADVKQVKPDSNDWSPCESGEVHRMVARLRTRDRNRTAAMGASGALFLVMAGFLGAWTFGLLPPSDPTYGGIACSDVRRLGAQYMAGALDDATARKIREHLEQCPECPRIFEQMRSTMPADGGTEVTRRPAFRNPIVAATMFDSRPSTRFSVDLIP